MRILAPSDRPALDPMEALAARSTAVVRFEALSRDLRMRVLTCGNPDCDCAEATFDFVPADGTAVPSFAVRVDLRTGAASLERASDAASATPLVEEVAAAVVPAVTDTVKERLRALREPRPRVGPLRLAPDWVDGGSGLLPLSHVLVGGLPDDPRWLGFLETRELDGVPWAIQDLYCPRKRCDCREAVLDFQRTDGGSAVFAVRIDLRTGEGAVEDPRGLEPDEAAAVWRAWKKVSPRSDRRVLLGRYEALRELAARPLEERAAPRSEARPAAPRPPGAKDPCPCGSGKRYKRCCGARA